MLATLTLFIAAYGSLILNISQDPAASYLERTAPKIEIVVPVTSAPTVAPTTSTSQTRSLWSVAKNWAHYGLADR
jgi:hypothetical protein